MAVMGNRTDSEIAREVEERQLGARRPDRSPDRPAAGCPPGRPPPGSAPAGSRSIRASAAACGNWPGSPWRISRARSRSISSPMSKANARWTVASSGSVIQARPARSSSGSWEIGRRLHRVSGRIGQGGEARSQAITSSRGSRPLPASVGRLGRLEPRGRSAAGRLPALGGAGSARSRIASASGSSWMRPPPGGGVRRRPVRRRRRRRPGPRPGSAVSGIAIARASWPGSAARPVPGRRESRD